MPTDVIKDDIDFLTFSAHKMLGPTGVGVLYAKEEYLEKMRPIEYGGGMNQYFEVTGEVEYKVSQQDLKLNSSYRRSNRIRGNH